MVEVNKVLIVLLIIFILWLPQAVNQLLTWTYWWQVKEYRLDRLWVFLKSSDGREKLQITWIFVKVFSLILGSLYLAVPTAIFLYLDFIFFKAILDRKVRKPAFTKRIEKIWLTSFLGLVLSFLFLYFFFLNGLILGEFLLILTPFLGILWTIPIVNKVKNQDIRKAKGVLSKVKPIVIGITGSYGKTSTKEFLAHLLSQRYSTAKTEGSENTEFGIARKTIKNISKTTKYYVVEMGAYKKGEIKKLADIVNPSLGIITGIEPQHLALFGSLENIKKAKFELIDTLPQGGTAIFNYSNKDCRLLAEKAKRLNKNLKVAGYSLFDYRLEPKPEMVVRLISSNLEGFHFEVNYKGERKRLFAPLAGVHFIENLTGAILVAKLLGLTWKQIKNGCRNLQPLKGIMQIHKLDSGTIVVDDSFNTTPRGFEAALKYLTLYKDKSKLVITPGIIELGKVSEKVHKNIGSMIKHRIDKVILLNEEPFKAMSEAVKDKNRILVVKESKLIRNIIEDYNKKKLVVLLEGRVPADLVEYFNFKI